MIQVFYRDRRYATGIHIVGLWQCIRSSSPKRKIVRAATCASRQNGDGLLMVTIWKCRAIKTSHLYCGPPGFGTTRTSNRCFFRGAIQCRLLPKLAGISSIYFHPSTGRPRWAISKISRLTLTTGYHDNWTNHHFLVIPGDDIRWNGWDWHSLLKVGNVPEEERYTGYSMGQIIYGQRGNYEFDLKSVQHQP